MLFRSLALADELHLSGRDVLTAWVVGYVMGGFRNPNPSATRNPAGSRTTQTGVRTSGASQVGVARPATDTLAEAIAGRHMPWTRERFEGYRRALREANLEVDDKLVFQAGRSIEDGASAALQMINEGVKPTAVQCVSDMVAVGAARRSHCGCGGAVVPPPFLPFSGRSGTLLALSAHGSRPVGVGARRRWWATLRTRRFACSTACALRAFSMRSGAS